MVQNQKEQKPRNVKNEIPKACGVCKETQCLEEKCAHFDEYQSYLRNVPQQL